jgi:zinc protease
VADELNRAKTQLVASALYRRDSQFAMASTYGQALSIGLTINDVDAWPTRIKAVTADNLRKVVARDLILKESVTGYLRPGK